MPFLTSVSTYLPFIETFEFLAYIHHRHLLRNDYGHLLVKFSQRRIFYHANIRELYMSHHWPKKMQIDMDDFLFFMTHYLTRTPLQRDIK